MNSVSTIQSKTEVLQFVNLQSDLAVKGNRKLNVLTKILGRLMRIRSAQGVN